MRIHEAVEKALKEKAQLQELVYVISGSGFFQQIPATAVISFQKMRNSSLQDAGIQRPMI